MATTAASQAYDGGGPFEALFGSVLELARDASEGRPLILRALDGYSNGDAFGRL